MRIQHNGKDALEGREREWWAKSPAHVLRLTGTLCYLNWAWVGGQEPEQIEVEFVEAAVQLSGITSGRTAEPPLDRSA